MGYAAERRLMGAWARWCDYTPTRQLGYGRNVIETLIQYGERIGTVHYHDEPDSDDTLERIDAAMSRLRDHDYAVWASLMARHRNIIAGIEQLGVWRGGRMRAFTGRELAEALAGHLREDRRRAKQRLSERCDRGYQLIRRALDTRVDTDRTICTNNG